MDRPPSPPSTPQDLAPPDAVGAAFLRGDYALAHALLADPALAGGPAHTLLAERLRLDPAIPAAGAVLLALWALIFFATV